MEDKLMTACGWALECEFCPKEENKYIDCWECNADSSIYMTLDEAIEFFKDF